MKQLQLSIGLIRRIDEHGHRTWLSVWNSTAEHLDFVYAERIEKESFRVTITRETAWALNLNQSDFLVSNMAQLNQELNAPWKGVPDRSLAVSFYNIDLYRRAAREEIETRTDLTWLTAREIYAKQKTDGTRINPDMANLVCKTQVIQQWDSGPA